MEQTHAKPIPTITRYGREEIDYTVLPRPFFARHPWVGYTIFLICLLAFAFLTWQVKSSGFLAAFDTPFAQGLHSWARQQPWPVALTMRFFSALGRDGLMIVMLLLAVGWMRHKQRRELWMLIFGIMGVELLFQLLSGTIGRERPQFKDPYETLIGFGYPSGHAATNILFCWMILYLLFARFRSPRWRLGLVAANLAIFLLIIFSRLFLGLHYVTDIIAGTLLGLGWGALIFTITDTHFWRPKQPN